jgi:hypothetical protein
MIKEQAEVFAAALRSGKYTQGTHYLQCKDRYCGLGVLLAINGITGTPDGDGVMAFSDGCGGSARCSIPRCYREKLGLSTDLGEFAGPGEPRSLSGMNDQGASFDEIADFVLKNYERL